MVKLHLGMGGLHGSPVSEDAEGFDLVAVPGQGGNGCDPAAVARAVYGRNGDPNDQHSDRRGNGEIS